MFFFGVGLFRGLSYPSPGVACQLRHGCVVAVGRSQGCDVGVFAGAWVRSPRPGVLGRTLNCQLPPSGAAAFAPGVQVRVSAHASWRRLWVSTFPGDRGGTPTRTCSGAVERGCAYRAFCGTTRPGVHLGRKAQPGGVLSACIWRDGPHSGIVPAGSRHAGLGPAGGLGRLTHLQCSPAPPGLRVSFAFRSGTWVPYGR